MFQFFVMPVFLSVVIFAVSKIRIEIITKENLKIQIFLLKFIKVAEYTLTKDEFYRSLRNTDNLAKAESENIFNNIVVADTKRLYRYAKELLEKIKYREIELDLNINTKDYIINSYLNAFLNTILSMFINKNIEKINKEKLYYIITTNKNETKLNLKCIMYGNFTNIIYILFKVIKFTFEIKKRGNDGNGKNTGTSNRKFNDIGNVITRIHD